MVEEKKSDSKSLLSDAGNETFWAGEFPVICNSKKQGFWAPLAIPRAFRERIITDWRYRNAEPFRRDRLVVQRLKEGLPALPSARCGTPT
jgi:hypothetical protein